MTPSPVLTRRLIHRFDHRHLSGLHVQVVGMARTGEAVTELLLRQGAHVIATDRDESKRDALETRFAERGVEFVFGPHEPIKGVQLIVVSPGVPLTGPLFEWAASEGIPVTGELELASRFCRRPLIAITGTNGKTTVTSMTGHIVERCGFGGETAGNIGNALANVVVEGRAKSDEPLILEVSSFQLETVDQFQPHVSVICNLAPDHLDRYRSLEEYYETKTRICMNQTPNDDLWIGPGVAQECYPVTEAMIRTFDIEEHKRQGLFELEGAIYYRSTDVSGPFVVPGWSDWLGQVRLNALASAGAVTSLGISIDTALQALRDYKTPHHRLEFVASVKGIRCYNDSKATNVHATETALQSVSGPVFLIAGGRHKGDSLAPLLSLIRQKVRVAYLVGESAELFAEAWRPFIQVELVRDVREAVRRALKDNEGPGTLLLSPACASWDMYKSYEERGDEFVDAVREAAK